MLDCVPFSKESLTFLKYLVILSFVLFFGFGIFLLASIQVLSLLNVPSLKSDGICGSVFCPSNLPWSCGDNFFLLRVTSFRAILLWWLKCSHSLLCPGCSCLVPQSISECPSFPLPRVSHLILSFEQLLSPSLWPQQSLFVKSLIKFIGQRQFWYFLLV